MLCSPRYWTANPNNNKSPPAAYSSNVLDTTAKGTFDMPPEVNTDDANYARYERRKIQAPPPISQVGWHTQFFIGLSRIKKR